MPAKILFIITQSEFGGAQQFLSQFILALDKNKYDITIAAGPDGDDEKGLLRRLEKKGINARHLRHLRRGINPLFDFGLGLTELYRLIKKERPDILFLCSSKAGAMGGFIGHLAGVSKVIYRIGGWTFNDPRPWWEKLFYKFIEKSSARWKDVIIVNAECHRKQAIELGIKPRDKIVTIYNGIDINKFQFLAREDARQELLPGIQNSIIIGTIANFYPAKGLEYLIEAASIIRNKFVSIKFIVIGEGEERIKLEELIKKHNLENNFFLVGAIPDAYKYLKAFDVYVLPSVKEGFPWAILEAMAAEVPLVATTVGAIPEVIEDRKTGFLIKPADARELAKAIIELMEDYSLRTEMAKNARQAVAERFSLEKMVKEIEKLL